MYSLQFSKNFPLPKNGGHFEFLPKMAKHKFASISLTVRDRAISSKFSTHRVSKECNLYNFQKIFPSPKMAAILNFIALIHPIQWTIAKPVGADRPAKRQKKTSCVSTGWPVPVLCIRKVAHGIYFLSRQHDVIASFSFGACTVQTCFQHLQFFKGKVCFMTDFQPYMWIFSV